MQEEFENGTNPIERKVQITGGSTYTVSIPKSWADARGIGSGSSVYLYPFDDRLILAQTKGNKHNWRADINIEHLSSEKLSRQIQAAYAAGSDEINIESETQFSTSERHTASQAITSLIGMQITTEGEHELTAESLLDTTEISLDGTIEQIRRIALSMHENAVDTMVTGENRMSPEQIASRDDEVDRLFALVSRQFYRILTDIREVHELQTDQRNAFTQFRTARQLERIADHAERIAAVADKQAEPPTTEVGAEFRTLGTDARRVVKTALDGDTSKAIVQRDEVVEQLDKLDSKLYNDRKESVYLYGRVLESIRRTAEYGGNIAEIVMLSNTVECS